MDWACVKAGPFLLLAAVFFAIELHRHAMHVCILG
jgi:hypothetical protein